MKIKIAKLFQNRQLTIFSLAIATFFIYFFCNPKSQQVYDYTFRVAANFWHGSIGFKEQPPSWLNEFVLFEGNWYSVFPFGSVVTMLPIAFFKAIGIINDMPGGLISALIASLIFIFLWLIAEEYEVSKSRKLLHLFGILFGTWMWANLAMAGAWHLALGFAMVGELGAIYFTYFRSRPILAGLFFAIAFGNRTEILLTAPMFVWLILIKDENNEETLPTSDSSDLRKIISFCVIPFILGIATLIYNYVRFHSFSDFGYARIRGVLQEPWYQYGIFSIWYIPQNFIEMLYTPWKFIPNFPYLVPTGFGGSIWWCSPFILYLFRFGARHKLLKKTAWWAIAILTFLLWIHGNPGGWQFGYRYAMILLPWFYLILLENSPAKITKIEWIAYIFSFFINAYATYLFYWTDYVQP